MATGDGRTGGKISNASTTILLVHIETAMAGLAAAAMGGQSHI